MDDYYRRRDRAMLVDTIGIFATFAILVGLFAYVMWAIEPAEFQPYRCENRGGISQAIGNKYGEVRSLVCADGTIQGDRTQVHGAGWKGVGEDR